MKFIEASKIFTLNKSTYINLRWIAYTGQLLAILIVQFLLQFKFNYLSCILIIFISILSNFYLKFKITENQLNNLTATFYLAFDITQLGLLLYLTGGITNPFIILIIIPSIFSAQYLKISSSIFLVTLTSLILVILTFFYYKLPSPKELHFYAPDYYLYSIPVAIFIGLIFLVYFGVKFGIESRIRKEAYDKIQEIMAKENELLSLGGQAAAAAHSLGTPLSTILLTVKELQKEFGNNNKINKDLELILNQSNRCSEILKKLSLNPVFEDEFIDLDVNLSNYVHEIVRSYQKISNKKFIINTEQFKNQIKFYKSSEIIYGLRNFIGNANKFSKEKVEIFLKSNKKESEIIITDDGPGFPKDLIEKHKLGEPYIRRVEDYQFSKRGLGLGTFIGKTLLEKNSATVIFQNSIIKKKGAEIIIKWNNKDLSSI
tara:strand:+ start:3529 stop:4818 length:1290 start_codon:yes stop_codon:yes gene_type:complete